MSLHRNYGDLEGARTADVQPSTDPPRSTDRQPSNHGQSSTVRQPSTDGQPNSDVPVDSNVQLLEHSYDDDFRQSTTSVITAGRSKTSSSRQRLYDRSWTRFTCLFVDWWMGELFFIIINLVAFGVLILILFKYDDRPLPRFSHNFSLSCVVLKLATISKSSLLVAVASAFGQFKWLWISSKQSRLQDLQDFDEASRGPLGAAKLLASRKCL